MRPPDVERAGPLDTETGSPKSDRLGGTISQIDSLSPIPPQPFHADSVWRRRKTNAELFAGCEFFALAERRRHR
jgi:hypothetical protein